MTKIDHMFASTEWLEIFPRTDLQALASLGSDHCPLFLQGMSFWISIGVSDLRRIGAHMPGFTETVQEAWNRAVNT